MLSNPLVFIALIMIPSPQVLCFGAELDFLQGKWQSRFQDQGRSLRVLKTIEKNKETVETYEGNRLVHRHVVELEEKQAEGITVMHYGPSEITHGPRKGQSGKPGSFISKRFGNTWYNVQGLETDGEMPLTVMLFKRVEETQSPPTDDAGK